MSKEKSRQTSAISNIPKSNDFIDFACKYQIKFLLLRLNCINYNSSINLIKSYEKVFS
jgi:hypothetical protein